jgi:glycerol-3-phosphate dehydrogenase (NAD(P)+)
VLAELNYYKYNMFRGKKIAMIGSGSWATAIAKMVHANADKLVWYVREEEIRESLAKQKRNCLYLSDVKFCTDKLDISGDINYCLKAADLLIFCVPSKFMKGLAETIDADCSEKHIISAIKGIVSGDNKLLSVFLAEKLGVSMDRIGVISGPCHAEEVALERLSYLTVGSSDQALTDYVSGMLRSHFIKTVGSADVQGIEYAAVLKNVMALATGIAHGLGYGDNFTSVLISNAIQEIETFLDKACPFERDVNNSVYLGDLLVTAYSQFSRNRTFGTMIGKGYSVKSAELEMNMIAECYYSVKCIVEINAQLGCNLPICQAVYNILYERYSPALEMQLLAEKLR